MRVSISKPTPFPAITGLWKNGPIHIFDRPKCWPIHILSFDFYTHLLLVVRQNPQSIHWIACEKAASKNLWAKNMCIYLDVRKLGPFTYQWRKIGSVITGLWKTGPIHILDRPKCWPIHILPFDFYTHLLLVKHSWVWVVPIHKVRWRIFKMADYSYESTDDVKYKKTM